MTCSHISIIEYHIINWGATSSKLKFKIREGSNVSIFKNKGTKIAEKKTGGTKVSDLVE
jgi:hypothetical protein